MGQWQTVRRGILALVFCLAWLGAGSVQAQAPNRAGLIVVHGDGQVETRCVGFTEETISGYDLLARSELPLRSEVTGMGQTICSLDNEGCDAGSHCFCQCLASPCVYWSYWQWEAGAWHYATLGAGNSMLGDGAIEGWVWSEGRMGQDAALKPPVLRFDDICTVEAPVYGVDSRDSLDLLSGISWSSLFAGVVVVALPFIVVALLWTRRRQV